MLRESQTAVVARNERWSGKAATEPYEAGWAREAVIFVRALKDAKGSPGSSARRNLARRHALGSGRNALCAADEAGRDRRSRASKHFGNWLRIAAELPAGAELTVLVTLHLKG